jgi:uncharacterized protein (DUF362 family)
MENKKSQGGGWQKVSRRLFLRAMAAMGMEGALWWLTGCTTNPSSQPHSVTDEPSPTPTPLPSLTPALQPSPTPSPEPTATPVADVPLFDEGQLARVLVAHNPLLRGYPASPPFDPDETYPEYPHALDELSQDNGAYRLVREALRLMNPQGYASAAWNPLGTLIQPGDFVLIKPNLVDDAEWANGQTTHPAFLRPIIDYAYKACGPNGRILLAEGPWAAGVFDRLVVATGIQAMVEHLAAAHGVPVALQDLNKAERGTAPLVDLGTVSELRAVQRVWYDAHGQAMPERGDPGVAQYRIAPWVLEADVVICVPKAKVHCSGGITVAMKNMLGIIPAWDGPYEQAVLKDCAHTSDVDRAAGEQGIYLDNDTIWRSMADLNRILLYADAQGVLHSERQRGYLAIVDGIVAAEESQYHPHPYPLNTVVIGTDPVTVDAVTARCMGFDPRRLKSVTQAAARPDFSLGPAHSSQIKVLVSGGKGLSALYRHTLTPELYVFSWQGHLEADDFDPPEILDWQWNPASGGLLVTVRDPAGVAWVRVAYSYEGQLRMKALQIKEGNSQDGRWYTPFPLGAIVRQATLLAGDELFNETAQEIAW